MASSDQPFFTAAELDAIEGLVRLAARTPEVNTILAKLASARAKRPEPAIVRAFRAAGNSVAMTTAELAKHGISRRALLEAEGELVEKVWGAINTWRLR